MSLAGGHPLSTWVERGTGKGAALPACQGLPEAVLLRKMSEAHPCTSTRAEMLEAAPGLRPRADQDMPAGEA